MHKLQNRGVREASAKQLTNLRLLRHTLPPLKGVGQTVSVKIPHEYDRKPYCHSRSWHELLFTGAGRKVPLPPLRRNALRA